MHEAHCRNSSGGSLTLRLLLSVAKAPSVSTFLLILRDNEYRKARFLYPLYLTPKYPNKNITVISGAGFHVRIVRVMFRLNKGLSVELGGFGCLLEALF